MLLSGLSEAELGGLLGGLPIPSAAWITMLHDHGRTFVASLALIAASLLEIPELM